MDSPIGSPIQARPDFPKKMVHKSECGTTVLHVHVAMDRCVMRNNESAVFD